MLEIQCIPATLNRILLVSRTQQLRLGSENRRGIYAPITSSSIWATPHWAFRVNSANLNPTYIAVNIIFNPTRSHSGYAHADPIIVGLTNGIYTPRTERGNRSRSIKQLVVFITAHAVDVPA